MSHDGWEQVSRVMHPDIWMTVETIAFLAGVSRTTVYKWLLGNEHDRRRATDDGTPGRVPYEYKLPEDGPKHSQFSA